MKAKYILTTLAGVLLSTTLTGCAGVKWGCKVGHDDKQGKYGYCGFGTQIPLTGEAAESLANFDPTQVSISLQGSSFPAPTSGKLLVAAKRADGSTAASQYFSYYKDVYGELKIKSPLSMTQWLQTNTPGASELEVSTEISFTPLAAGNKFSFDVSYGGESLSSGSGLIADSE